MMHNSIEPGETWRAFPLTAKASGDSIAAGTVNHYVKALTGANAGKWYRNSDSTWQATAQANAMTHQGDGHWTINYTASPFAAGIWYYEYAMESGNLHVNVGGLRKCEYSPSADSNRRVVIQVGTGAGQLNITSGAMVLTAAYDAAKTAAAPGAAMTLTAAYDAAKAAAQVGDAMTLAPAVIAAIRDGLSTFDPSAHHVFLDASQPHYAPAKAGDAMTLTAEERAAVASRVEYQIIDELDGQQVIDAFVAKIAAANPSLDDLTLEAIAAATRDQLERVGGMLAATQGTINGLNARATEGRLGKLDVGGILANTANIQDFWPDLTWFAAEQSVQAAIAVAQQALAAAQSALAASQAAAADAAAMRGDYQQRGQPVTLPAQAPIGYGPGAGGEARNVKLEQKVLVIE